VVAIQIEPRDEARPIAELRVDPLDVFRLAGPSPEVELRGLRDRPAVDHGPLSRAQEREQRGRRVVAEPVPAPDDLARRILVGDRERVQLAPARAVRELQDGARAVADFHVLLEEARACVEDRFGSRESP
jgi:hypothetical protein